MAIRRSFKRLVPTRFNGRKDRTYKRADGRMVQHSGVRKGSHGGGEIKQ